MWLYSILLDFNFTSMSENELSKIILDSAFKIHRTIGPGLLESVYKECLYHELKKSGLIVIKEKPVPLIYNEIKMEVGYRADLFVENKLLIEVKAIEALNDIHFSQVLTYLRLSQCKLGLLINFNVTLLKNGIRRVVNNL
jgi:GxxExxY protein